MQNACIVIVSSLDLGQINTHNLQNIIFLRLELQLSTLNYLLTIKTYNLYRDFHPRQSIYIIVSVRVSVCNVTPKEGEAVRSTA